MHHVQEKGSIDARQHVCKADYRMRRPLIFVTRPEDEGFIKTTACTLFHHTAKEDHFVSRLSVRSAQISRARSYFEIEIIECFGEIGIGFAPHFYQEKDRLGVVEFSGGYYSDGKMQVQDQESVYAPWKKGDVVGCGIFDETFFVTRNGILEGTIHHFFKPARCAVITVDGIGTKLLITTDLTRTRFTPSNFKEQTVRLPPDILTLIFLHVINGVQPHALNSQVSRLMFVSRAWHSALIRPANKTFWKRYIASNLPGQQGIGDTTEDIEDWYGCISSFQRGVRSIRPVIPVETIPRRTCSLTEADYIKTCPKYCVEEQNDSHGFGEPFLETKCAQCTKSIPVVQGAMRQIWYSPKLDVKLKRPDGEDWHCATFVPKGIARQESFPVVLSDGTQVQLDGFTEWRKCIHVAEK